MPNLKATWSINLKEIEHTSRGYRMDIESGGLYEVWLSLDDHPKPAIAIRHIPDHLARIEIWEVLVDGTLMAQRAGRIFRTGTAKPHLSAIDEIQQMIADQVRHMEDQKFLKLLSEMT